MMALAAAVVQTAHMHMGLLIGSCTMPASRSPLGAPRMVSSVIIYSHARTPARPHTHTHARRHAHVVVSLFQVSDTLCLETMQQEMHCIARSSMSDLF